MRKFLLCGFVLLLPGYIQPAKFDLIKTAGKIIKDVAITHSGIGALASGVFASAYLSRARSNFSKMRKLKQKNQQLVANSGGDLSEEAAVDYVKNDQSAYRLKDSIKSDAKRTTFWGGLGMGLVSSIPARKAEAVLTGTGLFFGLTNFVNTLDELRETSSKIKKFKKDLLYSNLCNKPDSKEKERQKLSRLRSNIPWLYGRALVSGSLTAMLAKSLLKRSGMPSNFAYGVLGAALGTSVLMLSDQGL